MDNKVAIITGGSEGIGKGIATALAKKGNSVYLIARTLDKLQSAQEDIRKKTGNNRVEIRQGDITNIDQIKGIIDEVYDKNKRLDYFINNAGTYKPVSLEMNFEDINKSIREMNALDMLAPYTIAAYLAKKFMTEPVNLHVLTIASQAALKVFDSGMGYGAAKAGLVSGLLHLEKEFEVRNVNNIKLSRMYPGTVATEKVLPLIRKGKLQNPTSLESVVDTAMDILDGKTPTRDVYVGNTGNNSIKRMYYRIDTKQMPYSIVLYDEELIDPAFDPVKYVEYVESMRKAA